MVRNKSTLGETESQQLTEISKSARHTAEALRDIVWVINPEHDKIDNLVLRMRDAANSMIRSDKVNFYCQSTKIAHVVDMDFRRNILLIYKEILHNIIKHARAKTIDIFIDETDSQFHLTVRDDGVGFDPSQPSPGHGMKTLKTRAGRLGGSVHFESAIGKGTTVVVTAKIP
jgi:signal transduction histidine kinase